MLSLNILLPFLSFAVVFIFAALVFRRYLERRGLHLAIWGLGLVMYGIGGFCEFYIGAFGWNALVFRLWYYFGAVLVAAWLGQGTVFLLARRRWAWATLVVLALASLFSLYVVFNAPLDSSRFVAGAQLTGRDILPRNVRVLTPFFNVYGTFTLVGGALYSAWIFWRKRILLHRLIGNIFIAVGAMSPAVGGTLSRFGLTEYLYLGEFLGAVLMFVGFLQATRAEAPRKVSVSEVR
jgi:hypothetical protein